MSRRQSADAPDARRRWRLYLSYFAGAAFSVFLVVSAAFLYDRLDHFLASDPRFRLPGPAETPDGPGLRIDGVVHASRERIVSAFAADFGGSAYVVPLAERRRTLLAIDWVKDATILRRWPDRITVEIAERTPVAFVQLPASRGSASFHVALIDQDGVILEPPARARFPLPVFTGIRREQTEEMRRVRVRQALRLLEDVGPLAGGISEINVADPDNLAVTCQFEGRAVVLVLGERNFRSRLVNFRAHYPEIRRRLPNATAFDLRLDDRITAMQEGAVDG